MKEEVIRKYVKDLDGLLKEIREWERRSFLWETSAEELMYHDAVVFTFGRLYKFFDFEDIMFGPRGGLDCAVTWRGETKNVEFEVFSKGFEEHIKKGVVKPRDYKDTIIVCWEHNWKDCPNNVDVIELKYFLG